MEKRFHSSIIITTTFNTRTIVKVVDIRTNKVIDFEVGDRSKHTYLKLALRIERRYKVKHLCTDEYSAYADITQYRNIIKLSQRLL